MSDRSKCVLCENDAKITGIGPQDDQYKCVCPNCGTFLVSDAVCLDRDLDTYKRLPKYLLAGYARELSDGGKLAFFDADSIKGILDSPLIPHSPVERLDKLLLWYYKQSDSFGKYISISRAPAICYAVDEKELMVLYAQVEEKQLVLSNGSAYLSLQGYKYCEKLLSEKSRSTRNAFVAMWFSDEVSNAYSAAIAPAIAECGYMAVRIDNVEHNNDITDEIIAGIKDSRFVVAEMTGYRGGVYYEAGFARGLGIPVIFTCRKDWFDGKKDEVGKTIKEKIHFDINHQNIIVWETEEELRKRIVNRIRATIL
jgi:nucleoside 2-deoxyribosyltransferase